MFATHARAEVETPTGWIDVEFPWSGWPKDMRPRDDERPDTANARQRYFDRLARDAARVETGEVRARRLCSS